jgi:polyisoprenoid-binding protein YceI
MLHQLNANKTQVFMKSILTMLLAAVLFVPAAVQANDKTNDAAVKWNVDRNHSNVTFSIRHFFTPVVGKFTNYTMDMNFDPNNLGGSNVTVEIDINSVNTNNDSRDGHLKTADFFDTEKYPKAIFKSTSIRKAGDNAFVMSGDLTIRNVTKKVEIPFTLLGVQDHPQRANTEVAGFEGSFKMNRLDFGVGSGDYISTAVIGNELTVNLFLSVNRQK